MSDSSPSEDCNTVQHGGEYGISTYLVDRKTTITPQEAFGILNGAATVPKERVCNVPPSKPRNGEVYLFHSEGGNHEDDFKADDYQWHAGGGGSMLPRSAPIVSRHYEQLIIEKLPKVTWTSGFKRTWYRSVRMSDETGKYVEEKSWTLVHYTGDHNLRVDLPHGNKKKPAPGGDFRRTAPSVHRDIKASNNLPQKVYGELLTKTAVPPAMKPRNKKEVVNHQMLMRTKLRATNDEICNIVLFGLQLKTFVRQVVVDLPTQSIGVYMVSEELCDMIKRIMALPKVPDRALQIQYDTTFNIGHFYFSMMSFRHPSFTNYPAVPFAFMIHTRKFKEMHNRLFEFVKEACKKLGCSKFVLVTDREFRDVTQVFPHVKHVFCWKHIESDIEVWVRGHRKAGAKDSREPMWYAKQVLQLMHSESEEEFELELAKRRVKWSAGFCDYFDTFMKPDILAQANRWLLEELGVYRGGTYGITTNPAEGLNTMIKSFHRFKSSLLMDHIVVSMHFLCKFYDVEEQRGRAGIGNWADYLCQEHGDYALSAKQILDDDEFQTPDAIVKFVLECASKTDPEPFVEQSSSDESDFDGNSIDVKVKQESNPNLSNIKQQSNPELSIPLDEPTKLLDAETSSQAIMNWDSQRTAAMKLVADGLIKRVQLTSERTVFVAAPNIKTVHSVTLKPFETCTCVSTRTCYHILAARLMEGKPLAERHGTLKLTNILFKARKRQDRKQAKQPRKNDYLNVVAAPDSAVATSTPKKREGDDLLDESNAKRPPKVDEVDEEVDEEDEENLGEEKQTDQSEISAVLREHQEDAASQKRQEEVAAAKPPSQRTQRFCYCKLVKTDQMVECTKCNNWYHAPTCADVSNTALDETDVPWECPSCSMPMVVDWGDDQHITTSGKQLAIDNTCPVDNAITIFGMRFWDIPVSWKYLNQEPAEAALLQAMQSFALEGAHGARRRWINFLLDNKTIKVKDGRVDLYGSEESRFFDFFKRLYGLRTTSKCSSRSCSKPRQDHDFEKLIVNQNDDIQQLLGMMRKPCTRGDGASRCKGTRTFETLTHGKAQPWLIVLDCVACDYAKVAAFPRHVELGGIRFEFGAVTLHSRGHFTAIVDWHGRRFHYDGNRRRHMEPIEHNAARLATHTPNIGVYFRIE